MRSEACPPLLPGFRPSRVYSLCREWHSEQRLFEDRKLREAILCFVPARRDMRSEYLDKQNLGQSTRDDFTLQPSSATVPDLSPTRERVRRRRTSDSSVREAIKLMPKYGGTMTHIKAFAGCLLAVS